MNIPGTAVALSAGRPVAVLERQGKVLRVFETDRLDEALTGFVRDYNRRRMFPTVNRLIIKQYPPEAAEVLSKAGFMREFQDYVIYRGSL
jgi:ATP-dependent Lhr-like helicase